MAWILYHPLPITVPPSLAICTSGIRPRKHSNLKLVFFFSLPFFCSLVVTFCSLKEETLLSRGPQIPSHTVGSATVLTTVFYFKRDISTLTDGVRQGTFVTLLLSPVIVSSRGCQMVRFCAHMVVFLRDHRSWPAWRKKI